MVTLPDKGCTPGFDWEAEGTKREIRSTLSLSLSLSDHLCFKQQEKAEREKPLVPSKPELELYLSPQKEIGRR
jgi:hypothetical protein